MTKKVIFGLILFGSIILCICFYTFYTMGKDKAKQDCLNKEVQVKTETIEVIKYINNKDSEIYARPSSDFESLLQRMERNEL